MRLAALALSLFALARPAFAVQGYVYGPSLSTTTGRATEYRAGVLGMSASSVTIAAPTIILNGNGGTINSSGTITSISSITATAFFGDGSHLSGVGGVLSGGITNVYPKWTGSSTVGNSFTNETSTGVSVLSNQYVSGNASVAGGVTVTGQETVVSTLSVKGNAFAVGTSSLVVTGGSVGIGTVSPASVLEISGDATATDYDLRITNTASSGRSWRLGEVLSAGSFHIYDVTGSAARLSINASGNVGIGNTSPAVALDVTGTIRQSTVKSCVGGLQTDSSGNIISCNSGSGSGNVITTATQTFSGANTFVSSAIIANGGMLAIGDSAAATMYKNNGIVFYAKSVDGVAQSSGCVGAMQASVDSTSGVLTWTSTNTLNGSDLFAVHITAGVLLDPGCAPGAFCRFGMIGMYLVPWAGTGLSGQYVGFSATRCAINGTTNVNAAMGNGMITGEDTDNPVYIYKWK